MSLTTPVADATVHFSADTSELYDLLVKIQCVDVQSRTDDSFLESEYNDRLAPLLELFFPITNDFTYSYTYHSFGRCFTLIRAIFEKHAFEFSEEMVLFYQTLFELSQTLIGLESARVNSSPAFDGFFALYQSSEDFGLSEPALLRQFILNFCSRMIGREFELLDFGSKTEYYPLDPSNFDLSRSKGEIASLIDRSSDEVFIVTYAPTPESIHGGRVTLPTQETAFVVQKKGNSRVLFNPGQNSEPFTTLKFSSTTELLDHFDSARFFCRLISFNHTTSVFTSRFQKEEKSSAEWQKVVDWSSADFEKVYAAHHIEEDRFPTFKKEAILRGLHHLHQRPPEATFDTLLRSIYKLISPYNSDLESTYNHPLVCWCLLHRMTYSPLKLSLGDDMAVEPFTLDSIGLEVPGITDYDEFTNIISDLLEELAYSFALFQQVIADVVWDDQHQHLEIQSGMKPLFLIAVGECMRINFRMIERDPSLFNERLFWVWSKHGVPGRLLEIERSGGDFASITTDLFFALMQSEDALNELSEAALDDFPAEAEIVSVESISDVVDQINNYPAGTYLFIIREKRELFSGEIPHTPDLVDSAQIKPTGAPPKLGSIVVQKEADGWLHLFDPEIGAFQSRPQTEEQKRTSIRTQFQTVDLETYISARFGDECEFLPSFFHLTKKSVTEVEALMESMGVDTSFEERVEQSPLTHLVKAVSFEIKPSASLARAFLFANRLFGNKTNFDLVELTIRLQLETHLSAVKSCLAEGDIEEDIVPAHYLRTFKTYQEIVKTGRGWLTLAKPHLDALPTPLTPLVDLSQFIDIQTPLVDSHGGIYFISVFTDGNEHAVVVQKERTNIRETYTLFDPTEHDDGRFLRIMTDNVDDLFERMTQKFPGYKVTRFMPIGTTAHFGKIALPISGTVEEKANDNESAFPYSSAELLGKKMVEKLPPYPKPELPPKHILELLLEKKMSPDHPFANFVLKHRGAFVDATLPPKTEVAFVLPTLFSPISQLVGNSRDDLKQQLTQAIFEKSYLRAAYARACKRSDESFGNFHAALALTELLFCVRGEIDTNPFEISELGKRFYRQTALGKTKKVSQQQLSPLLKLRTTIEELYSEGNRYLPVASQSKRLGSLTDLIDMFESPKEGSYVVRFLTPDGFKALCITFDTTSENFSIYDPEKVGLVQQTEQMCAVDIVTYALSLYGENICEIFLDFFLVQS